MSISENKKHQISNTYDQKNNFEPFIKHEKPNVFYEYKPWKWIDGEWIIETIETSKDEVSNY
jgi:hypothetical protein